MASKFGYKRMKTTAEIRAISAADGVPVRAKRNAANLPSHYDDRHVARQPRSDRYKNHRA